MSPYRHTHKDIKELAKSVEKNDRKTFEDVAHHLVRDRIPKLVEHAVVYTKESGNYEDVSDKVELMILDELSKLSSKVPDKTYKKLCNLAQKEYKRQYINALEGG